ncbi:hypothetical protein OS493_036761 [Desmophyllum pertusum]|uniref:Uncharacterized protein n=1 Tax=Desmophyllum pertusum TaxID=174260 RepID=A0A9W9YUS4_9CNID|nr:hypothetical protein OS493_036761 [Desmophyllum pertusum]
MLFYAILYSDVISSGLNPIVQSNVEDLRKFRNEQFNGTPQGHLSDLEFQNAIRKVHAAFQALCLSTLKIQDIRNQRTIRLKMQGPEHSDVATTSRNLGNVQTLQSIPLYILARGDEAKAAYQRALESGTTSDKRVKVLLIGQDRVGKTSVGRSLKGEEFRKDESSTDGVHMDIPLKHVGAKPWNNSTEEQEMTAFDHKSALYVSDHLSTASSEGKALGKEDITEKIAELSVDDELHEPQEKKTTTKDVATHVTQDAAEPEYGNPDEISSKKREKTTRMDDIPDKVTRLAIKNLSQEKSDNDDGIWPVIWDFAGQAIFRAIHPIFVSREAIYVLVIDLTKELSAIAQCLCKRARLQGG